MKRKNVLYLLGVCAAIALGACGGQETASQTESVEVAEDETLASEVTESLQGTMAMEEASEDMKETEAMDAVTEVQESEAEEVEEQASGEYDVPENFAAVQDGVNYGTMVEITYDSKTTGTTRKANIVLPPDYSEEKEYPVLYLLHGIGGNHNEWKNGQAANVIGNLVAAGETSEMIVVMPNVRARANDGSNPSDIYSLEHYQAFDNFINDLRDDLMPFMEANYAIATGKENTAIAGLSMGGRESLYIGFSMPETFGYIGAFCPAPGLLPYSNFGVSEEGLFTEETFTLPEGSDNFVMIVAGLSDTVVGAFPSTYHQTLENNGVEHVFYETPGGHDFGVWRHGLYNFAKHIF